MKYTTTIICALIGFLLLHFPGLILGAFLGRVIEGRLRYQRSAGRSGNFSGFSAVQNIFFKVTFQTLGFVAKSGGRITERDIQAARDIMQDLNISGELKEKAISYFYEGKNDGFKIYQSLRILRSACWRAPDKLRYFMNLQIQAVNSSRSITASKQNALRYIAEQLNLHEFHFDSHESAYQSQQRSYQQSYQRRSNRSSSAVNNPYRVLNISTKASDAEAKRAYRKLISKHHPDRLIAQGASEQKIKEANSKTQQIKAAYEQICANRGI